MTDQLEVRLERDLAAQAEAFPNLPDRELSTHRLDRSAAASVSWPGHAAVVLAAAAVLLLIGGPVWLLTRAPGTLESGALGGSPTDELAVEWSRAIFAPDGWELGPIASSSQGTVVIGHSRQGSEARAWFSTDGTNWAEIDAFDGRVVIRDLTAGSFGFLASGLRLSGTDAVTTTLGDGPRARPPASTIWYSSDGMTWTETVVPLPPVAERLSNVVDHDVRRAAGNGRVMVAAGDETDESGADDMADGVQVIPSRPLVWWSEDGSTWRLVDEPAWKEATSTMAIAASSDRVAVVIAFGGESPSSTVWTSVDGRSWDLVYEFESGLFCDLSGSTVGFLAVCNDGTARFSVDGSVWNPSYLRSEGRQVGLVTGGEKGFVAILVPNDLDPRTSDMSQVETLVYRTSDGRRWVPLSEPGTFESGFSPTGIGSSKRGFVMVGNRYGPGAIIDQIESIVAEMWIGVPQS